MSLNRTEEISNLLLMVGADTSPATIKMIDRFVDFIPTNYLNNFTEFILENYSQYKKPIVNITSSASEFRAKLILVQIRRGEFEFEDVEETKEFVILNFNNKEIANNLTGYYKNFVTIALEDGRLKNLYANIYLDSKEANEFWVFIHFNQHKIGDVRVVETEEIKEFVIRLEEIKAVEAKKEKIEKNQPIDKRVLSIFGNSTKIF